MKKYLFFIACIFIGTFLGCSHKSNSSKEIVFKECLGQDLGTTDPHKMVDINSFGMSLNIFEGLFRVNPKTGLSEYGLAKNHTVSKDNLVYTFYLRDDIYFSDGTPITAQDFIDSWKRAINPATGSRSGQLFGRTFQNGKDIITGKTPVQDLSVYALDEKTLEVHLAFPALYFIQELSTHIAVVLPMHLVKKSEDGWNKSYPLVSSGAYVITEWKPNNKFILEKNPHYYDFNNVALTKIINYTTDDPNVAYNMYLNGEVDFIKTLSPDKTKESLNRSDLFRTYFNNGCYFFYNMRRKPFDNIKVRHALALAIDRESLAEKILGTGEKALYSYIYKMPNYPSKKYVKKDLLEAKRLLAEAGYPEGKGFPSFNVIFGSNETNRKVTEFLQQQWKENLGISMVLKPLEWKTFLSLGQAYEYDTMAVGWVPEYSDPFPSLYFLDPRSTYFTYRGKEFAALLDESDRIADSQKRLNKLAEAESILMRDMPVVPLYTAYKNSLFNFDKWEGDFLNERDVTIYRGIKPKS